MKSKNLKITVPRQNEHMFEFFQDTFIETMHTLDLDPDEFYDIYLNNAYIGTIDEGNVFNYSTNEVISFYKLMEMITWE